MDFKEEKSTTFSILIIIILCVIIGYGCVSNEKKSYTISEDSKELEKNQTIDKLATPIKNLLSSGNGRLIWAKRAGGLSREFDHGFGITTLSDNSIVVTGDFYGSATFGPGEPNQTILTSQGGADIFIARYNLDGTLKWAKCAGGPSLKSECGYGVTTLSDDSIVVTGGFSETATFGLGEPNQNILTSAGKEDIFIARYNSDGMVLWVKSAGGAYEDGCGYGVTSLSDDSVIVTGYFGDTAIFGPGEPEQTCLTNAGQRNVFIARYNPNGALSWVKQVYGSTFRGLGITSLSDNSIALTGGFYGIAIFAKNEPNQIAMTIGRDYDLFIARYKPDGSLSWANRAGGPYNDEGRGITALSDNSVVVTGCFNDSVTFGLGEANETILTTAGQEDIFIARFNPNGTLVWAEHNGGLDSDMGCAITSLSDDSVVVTGILKKIATFGSENPNQTVLTSVGYSDIFIARFDSHGAITWANCAGGAHMDVSNRIATLSDGSTVITGNFNKKSTFGSEESNQTTLISDGSLDIFIARFGL